jgi:hypothetical protein
MLHDRFFHLFVARLASFDFLRNAAAENDIQNGLDTKQRYAEDDDLDQCLYYLQKLSNVLRWSPDATWAALARNVISTDKSHPSLYLIGKLLVEIRWVLLTLISWSGHRDLSSRIFRQRMLTCYRWQLRRPRFAAQYTQESAPSYSSVSLTSDPPKSIFDVAFGAATGAPTYRPFTSLLGWTRSLCSSFLT